MRYFAIFLSYQVSKIWRIYSTFRFTEFQILNNQMWLVVAVLRDSQEH